MYSNAWTWPDVKGTGKDIKLEFNPLIPAVVLGKLGSESMDCRAEMYSASVAMAKQSGGVLHDGLSS